MSMYSNTLREDLAAILNGRVVMAVTAVSPDDSVRRYYDGVVLNMSNLDTVELLDAPSRALRVEDVTIGGFVYADEDAERYSDEDNSTSVLELIGANGVVRIRVTRESGGCMYSTDPEIIDSRFAEPYYNDADADLPIA